MKVHYTSSTAECLTPALILEAVLECMGGIDLDPCAEALTEEHESHNVPAQYHFTKEQDGLSRVWFGRVFMNPPYGKEILHWVDKLVCEYALGRVTEAIALVPARTDTKWWGIMGKFPVCFVRGRLVFGGSEGPAPFPSALFYLGRNKYKFIDSFKPIGDIWERKYP